jgi:hypothetical protein
MDTTKLVGRTMDMKELKVGQHVRLSGALPGAESTEAVVTIITDSTVSVKVNARLEGEDGGYWIIFDYDNSIDIFYGWLDPGNLKTGWDISAAVTCPIPDLKIVDLVTDK